MLNSELIKYVDDQINFLDTYYGLDSIFSQRLILINPVDLDQLINIDVEPKIYNGIRLIVSKNILPGLPSVVTKNIGGFIWHSMNWIVANIRYIQ